MKKIGLPGGREKWVDVDVGEIVEAAQALNGAMVAYHREHALPDEFLREHLALTGLLALPKRGRTRG